MSKCPSDKELVESLLKEVEELHQLLKEARSQACVLMGCYIAACSAYEKARPEFIASSIANRDPHIFRFKSVDEIPEQYKAQTNFLMEVVDHYAEDDQSVLDVAPVMMTWPSKERTLH